MSFQVAQLIHFEKQLLYELYQLIICLLFLNILINVYHTTVTIVSFSFCVPCEKKFSLFILLIGTAVCFLKRVDQLVVVSFSHYIFPFDFVDIDTRRRAACDLVRGLCKFFEGPVTGIFSGYVNSMLQEYAKNPSVNWKHKDAAIYLVTSLASKAQTQKVIFVVIVLFLKQSCR